MTSAADTADPLSTRRRKARFRAWHRGMREMDLVLGSFADREIDRLDEAELAELERLMELNDQDLIRWVTGEVPVPEAVDSPLYRRIAAYRGPTPA